MAWNEKAIERLKKYIDANRYFEVHYRDNKVYGMDFPEDEEESAEFYLEEYDDVLPEGILLDETKTSDFKVYLLKPVKDWTKKDPDWSESES